MYRNGCVLAFWWKNQHQPASKAWVGQWKPAPRPSGLGAGFHRPTLALLVGSSQTCEWTEVSWHCHVGKQSQYNLDEPSKLHTNSKGCNWCCLSFFLYLYMFDSSLCYGYCKRYSYVPPNLFVKPRNTTQLTKSWRNSIPAMHYIFFQNICIKSNLTNTPLQLPKSGLEDSVLWCAAPGGNEGVKEERKKGWLKEGKGRKEEGVVERRKHPKFQLCRSVWII